MSSPRRSLPALGPHQVLLMDGAMGTELFNRGWRPGNQNSSEWNLTHPCQVLAIHRSYIDAGANCLLTNTFNVADLAANSLDDWLERARTIIAAGVKLAREAAGPDRLVFGSLGPCEKSSPRLGAHAALISSFAGVDGLLLETQAEISLADLLIGEQRGRAASLPLLVSFTFDNSAARLLVSDAHREWIGNRRHDLAAVGVNCGRQMGTETLCSVLETYRGAANLPILVRPNAGTPLKQGELFQYPVSSQELADAVPRFISAGAQLIGGCCGTTPDHIAACRRVIDRLGVGWKGD